MLLTFLKSLWPFGRPAGRLPCISLQASSNCKTNLKILARGVFECQPASLCSAHHARLHSSHRCIEAAGAARAFGHQAPYPTRDLWLFQSKNSSIKTMRNTIHKEGTDHTLLATTTPFCSSQDTGVQKAGGRGAPPGWGLLHQSPGGHKRVRVPCEEAKVAWAESLVFLSNTPLT